LAGKIEPDYVIHNNGTLDELHEKVDEMLKSLYD
jgi:dephospho-CoA kinase